MPVSGSAEAVPDGRVSSLSLPTFPKALPAELCQTPYHHRPETRHFANNAQQNMNRIFVTSKEGIPGLFSWLLSF